MTDALDAAIADVDAASARVAALIEGVARRRPPNRRPTVTAMIEGGGIRAHATIGYEPETMERRHVQIAAPDRCACGAPLEYLRCTLADGSVVCLDCADSQLQQAGMERPRTLRPEDLGFV